LAVPPPKTLTPEDREALRARARTAGRRKVREWLIMAACVIATVAMGWLFMAPLP